LRLFRLWRAEDGFGSHVYLRGIIRLPCALVKLLARGLGLGVRVRRGQLLLVIRRALFALAGARVPADFRTDPPTAARALMKVRLALFDGLLQSLVVALAADRALYVVG
jgi:hypothetical protein